MWREYINATSLEQALEVLREQGEKARIVAGATDLILELERGVRKGIEILVDITRVTGLDQITMDEDEILHLGPLVTHNHCVASKLVRERAFPLARAAWEVGAPQIRNRGTIAGNLITASPANDTITPLMALGAKLTLKSSRGERIIPIAEFYTGVRRTVMQPDEMLVDIAFPALTDQRRGTFIKLGLRRAQAISVVNAAVIVSFEPEDGLKNNPAKITDATITLGAVAPTIIHAQNAEIYLRGRDLSIETMEQAALLAMQSTAPIDDVRSSADYRREMVRVCVLRALRQIATHTEQQALPENPVLLWGKDPCVETPPLAEQACHEPGIPIITTINGKTFTFESGHTKTLLRLLREDAGLIGTKEGCAEGECGACTVFLDGIAVMACLVPAARAHLAEIVTIEGLAAGDQIHPVQQAFLDTGAVQCGYCTPGFIMSAAKLLEERPHPSSDDIKHAITGNLCRCTGYYKIIEAIERASLMEVAHG